MKLKLLALGAAVASITCVTPCSAQLQIESSTATQPQHRVAYQTSQESVDVFGPGSTSGGRPRGNSGYFAEGEQLREPRSVLSEPPSNSTNTPPSIAHQPALATPSVGVLANTPEVGMIPVYWPDSVGGCRLANPIADAMMRTWCTEGLWDTYPAQRARLCAHIQHHTGNFNRYTQSCSSCDSYQAHAWTAAPATSYAQGGIATHRSADPLAGRPERPQTPVAQLVMSPVLSAPAQLPSAQVVPRSAPRQPISLEAPPSAKEMTYPASPQPTAPQYEISPSPLPAGTVPSHVPVVASRSPGFLR